jgi:undecaprenyl diphosphate synthase
MSENRIDHDILCVGFIMDGNRRWAEQRGLKAHEGHLHGYNTFKDIVRAVHSMQIPHMVCYAFSTENWKRDPREVSFLMRLMQSALEVFREDHVAGVNYRIIGQRERLPVVLQHGIEQLEKANCANPSLTVWIALSYGGRAEIVDAVQRAVAQGVSVSEESFASLLWTDGMPDPDLIIRTSGEQRISNFLLWQSAYSEYVFTDTLWPDFGEREFQSIVEAYGKRKRRKGQ